MLQNRQLPQKPSSLYPIEGTSLLRNPEQSRICRCALLPCTAKAASVCHIQPGRESSCSRSPSCGSHSCGTSEQLALGSVTWAAGAAAALLTKEPPWWQPHALLGTCHGANYSKIREVKENIWGGRAMVCEQARGGVAGRGNTLAGDLQNHMCHPKWLLQTKLLHRGEQLSLNHTLPPLGNMQSYTWVYRHI